MKQILSIILLIVSFSAYAGEPIVINATPDKATVFLKGAQIFHSKSVNIPAGNTDIVIEGIPQNIDQNSIQAGGKGAFTILDVQYRLFYPEPVQATTLPTDIQKKITKVSDSILDIDFLLKDINNKRDVLNVQKQMLLNNRLIIATAGNDSLQLLQASVEYYNSKLNELYAEELKLEKRELEANTERGILQQHLYELQNYWNQQNAIISNMTPVPQIIVSVAAESAVSAKLEINYITYNAGWYATYDIRASDLGQPVELSYKANIWQTSGIDWKNVKITCSTGNPTLGNTLPQLTTWYVGYYQYYYGKDYDSNKPEAGRAEDDVNESITTLATKSVAVDAGYANTVTTQTQTLANVEFEINQTYTIPTDGKGHLVTLQTNTLPADYNYLIVPKIEQSAFLIARITDWESANLLPGNANIYFNNTYISKTYLDPLTLSDTLSLSMGRDKSIEVKRVKVADKSRDKIIGSNNTKTMAFDISVRNGKPISLEVIVMDQIPISQNADIKVVLTSSGKGTLDELTGFITWREKLKSKELSKYSLEFEITYPKNQTLSIN